MATSLCVVRTVVSVVLFFLCLQLYKECFVPSIIFVLIGVVLGDVFGAKRSEYAMKQFIHQYKEEK